MTRDLTITDEWRETAQFWEARWRELYTEVARLNTANDYAFGELAKLRAEIERQTADVELWKDRYEAERCDHEALLAHLEQEDKG